MLKACLNGARVPDEHQSLPVTPAEVAADVAAARGAGAAMVHVHVKDAAVGVTTGAWAAPAIEDRLTAITSWSVLPDFASVNWHEDGAEAVANALLSRGVAVEAGLWTEPALHA